MTFDNDDLRKRLQLSYYNILKQVVDNQINNEETILMICEKIKQVLNLSSAIPYLYDNHDTYHLLCPLDSYGKIELLENNVKEKILFNEVDLVKGELGNSRKKFLHFSNQVEKKILVVLSSKGEMLSDKQLQLVEEETISLFTLFNQNNIRIKSLYLYGSLFKLSNQIFTKNDINDIIIETCGFLDVNFPNMEYCLLLAQDVDVPSWLTVKNFEYSNGQTNSNSTKAFLTGDIQVDIMGAENTITIDAPLNGKQGIYGVLEMKLPNIASLPKRYEEFLLEFTNMTGKAIENATLFQNSKEQVSDLTIINETSHQLNLNLNLEEVVYLLKEKISSVSQADEIGIIRYHDQKKESLLQSSRFINSKEGSVFLETLYERTDIFNEPLFIGNYTAGTRSGPSPYCSVMTFPMIQTGKVLGLVIVLHKDSYYFSFNIFKLIHAIIQHSTLAMANTILQDQLKKAVITDYLTGLYSRKYLEDTIQRHMNEGEKGVLILFDIDDFKEVNDRYGHHIGDKVLIQVANIIRDSVNNKAIAARWGGEEIAIYAPNFTLDDGYLLAESVNARVEILSEPMVTLSAGVSAWYQNTKEMITLFLRTDQALYEAKNNGKNQVIKN